jgi:hypothetical protein
MPAYIAKGGNEGYRLNPGRGYYYDYYKLDSLLRARTNLQSLSPGATNVILPNFGQLTKSEYQSPVGHQLEPWNQTTEAALVAEGMRQFIIYLNIEGQNMTPTFLVDRLNILSQLYRLGPVDKKTGALDCQDFTDGQATVTPESPCMSIDPKQIIDLTFKLEAIANTSSHDIQVLQWTGSTQKFEDSFWIEMAMEKDTRRPLGMLDITFQRVADDTGPQSGSVDSVVMQDTQTYYESEQAVGKFLFPPRDEIKKMIKANYKSRVKKYQELTENFINAVKDVEKNDPYKVKGLVRSTDATIGVNTGMIDGQSVPLYLSQSRLDKYASMVNKFHLRTNNEFVH